jgi:SNF2 family DNA or RNA helicase
MTPTLRPYQKEDAEFLSTLNQGACFNEQRTGKTPTALGVFNNRQLKRYLVVCPKSAIMQWADEVNTWTFLTAIPVIGTKSKKQKTISEWTEGVLIINYDSLKQTTTSEGLFKSILKQHPEGLILDEAHRIKNHSTQTSKAIFYLATHIRYRLALTGTPIDKCDHLFSLLKYILPQQFPSYWSFVSEYCSVSVGYAPGGRTFKQIDGFKEEKLPELQQILDTYCTQRKRKDILPWLPEKDYQKIFLQPSAEQTKAITELETFFETKNIVTQGILDRLIRIRQICTAPEILDISSKTSPKFDWIIDFITDYPDKPILIFTNFTTAIKLLEKRLSKFKFGVISGETSINNRNKYKQAFQNGEINILLINIQAGKEALTLDRAEASIFLDKYPPVSSILQAEDRFIATTESKKDKPHTIYELILQKTYDEQLYQLLEQRASETDVINNYKKYIERRNTV